MKTILNKSLLGIALIIFGVVFQPSLQAQVLGRGFSGAMGGAILGSLVGGREGAQAGAAIGGAVGLVLGFVGYSDQATRDSCPGCSRSEFGVQMTLGGVLWGVIIGAIRGDRNRYVVGR